MYGRSVYSVWLKKYGKKEADRRQEEMHKKQSKSANKKRMNNGAN